MYKSGLNVQCVFSKIRVFVHIFLHISKLMCIFLILSLFTNKKS